MLTLLKEGDMSTAVYALQSKLKSLGYTPDSLGYFDVATRMAVQAFQRVKGLSPDGIVGPQTLKALGLEFHPTSLKDADYDYAARRLGCEAKLVKAFTMVEAPNGGFNSDETPVILYERHYFYRQLMLYKKPGESDEKRAQLRDWLCENQRDICYPKPLTFAKFLPSGAPVDPRDRYGASSQQYERLKRAQQYSDSAALESASWGRFQIMGENWSRIGWKSVQAFVRAMYASERDHLDAFIGFVRSKPPLVQAMQKKDWANIAKYYNGTAQVSYYGPRLEQAYYRL